MNHLYRDLAPITPEGWERIETEAKRTLKFALAGRKVVDFDGAHGWEYSAIPLGRANPISLGPDSDVETRMRLVQCLVEICVPFLIGRDQLEAAGRGATDIDLLAVTEAARQLARAEDRLIFDGNETACIRGIVTSTPHSPITLSGDYSQYPDSVSMATQVLREAGVDGPYALLLSPRCHTGLSRTAAPGGYPVLHHVRRLAGGPLVWAPSLEGALVLSMRGGDFQLVVGQDVSVGYRSHDDSTVTLYLEESLTFRLLEPQAAVVLTYC